MICTCPKCSAQIEAEEPSSPEKGGTAKCPDCNSRFWAQRENFLLRAFKKDWKIFCCNCGSEVGPDTFCQGCSLPFPDYWVVQSSKPSRRYPYQPALSLDFSLGGTRRRQPGSYGYSEDAASTRSPFFMLIGVLAVLVALVLGASYYFLGGGGKSDRKFSENYVFALYGVKSGVDASIKRIEQMSSKGMLTAQELATIDNVKSEIDAALAKAAAAPPPEAAAALDRLNQLHAIYGKLYALSKSSASLAEAKQLEAQFNEQALEMARTLPEELKNQLRQDAIKYRSLQFLVQ